jgi:hypothetical protein
VVMTNPFLVMFGTERWRTTPRRRNAHALVGEKGALVK